jgi:hypothetical protein
MFIHPLMDLPLVWYQAWFSMFRPMAQEIQEDLHVADL